MPDPAPENEEAEEVYLSVEDQLVMAGNILALNQLAIYPAMELYQVAHRRDCFEKVVMLGRHFIRKQIEEANE